METLRTPDGRFAELDGWPYEPRYAEVGNGLRMHYVDEGPRDGPAVLLAHGTPTWGYLYRKMIPGLLAAGRRVVVPDLIGFGRSDKPASRDDYTYVAHVNWCTAWIDVLGLTDVTLFAHDWGGQIFLVDAGRNPGRYRGIVVSNTALIDPNTDPADYPPEVLARFMSWLKWSQEEELLSSVAVGGESPLNQTGHRLTPGEQAAYEAPFPDESYRAGARQFPLLVPIGDADPPASMLRQAWAGLEKYDGPFVTAFAGEEDVTRFFEPLFQARVPGAAGRDHPTIPNAGHFLQEQQPDRLVEVILSLG